MGAFPSGQWGQTVNLLLNASVVRIHQLPPKGTRNLGCGFFFVLELVDSNRSAVRRRQKQSCGLFFRPRLANPPAPTKKPRQRYCRGFFSLLYRTKPAKAMTDFQSAFYRDVQLLPGGWIFLLPTFSAAFRMLRQYRIILSAIRRARCRSRRPWSGSCPSCKIRNRAQNCSGHLQSGRKTGIIATVTCLSSSAG